MEPSIQQAYHRLVPTAVVGRDAELASIRDFVTRISDGGSMLVLEGEAGMGKTTLWRDGVDVACAEGLCVLQAEPAESETALSFSGLGDLLDPVLDDVLAPLPAAQASALARALVLEDAEGPPPDAHVAGVALLNVFRGLCRDREVLVAVDDVQWLDAATASALSYATRRLKSERIGVLLSRRSGLESSYVDDLLRSDRLAEIRVEALDAASLHQVVQTHLGVALPRPLLAEVHQASGGNPFFALEIVRSLGRSGTSVEAGKPLPVPDSLHDLVHGRLLALPSESRDFLAAAAAHAHPTVSITEDASGVDRTVGLAPALAARVVETHRDEIRFAHPLLAAGALEVIDPLRRRKIHAALAQLLQNPEARAWQLAASVDQPDETVAEALEDAARHARARGAPRPAALLLDRARELTPPDESDKAFARAIDAAYFHYVSGDSPRAEAQLRAIVRGLPPGHLRATAVMRLARVRAYEALPEAAELYMQAVEEAEGDREVLAVAHEGVAFCLWRLYERLDDVLEHADMAAKLALELDNEALAGEALATRLVAELLLGRETADATAERALALQPAAEELRVLAQPRSALAMDYLGWTDRLSQAREELLELLQRARELGDESSPPYVLAHLSLVECELGDLTKARGRALEGQEAALQSGQRAVLAFNLALEALIEAQRGNEERVRTVALEALRLAAETGVRQAELIATYALGQLELALDHPSAVSSRLEPLLAFVRQEAIAEPSAIRFVVDYAEALIELGRVDEAAEVLDWYEGHAERLGRMSALAAARRCRGLLAAQTGDVEAALAAYGEALDRHAQVELPLDRGRTLLALGAAQRRAKRRREARATLEEAFAVFEEIGAALWADRARAELKRISGRAATPGALTPAEERVAALVGEGKTNKEVAAALYLSDRTVEGHLARIFGKLGIRHRSELAGALQIQGSTESNTGGRPVSAGPSAP
jgi:DNA-binding CsgD family transcriptional regulator